MKASLYILLYRRSYRAPCRVAAFHEARIESGVAQSDRGLASDVKSVGAKCDDGLRLRELAHPILHAFGIAPRGAFDDVLLARDEMPRARVDELHRLSGVEHRLHFFDADGRQIAKLRLLERARRRDLGRILISRFDRFPVEISHEGVNVRFG